MKLFLPTTFFFLLLCITSISHAKVLGHTNFRAPVSVLVYPNPSTDGIFTLEFQTPLPTRNGPVWVRVYDLIGNELLSKRYEFPKAPGKDSFSIENYPKGVYLLEISQGDRKQTLRISFI